MALLRSYVSAQIIDDCVEADLLDCAYISGGEESSVGRDDLYAALIRGLLEQAEAEGISVRQHYDEEITSESITVFESTD